MNSPELKRTMKRLGWLVLLFGATALIISAVERKEASLATGMTIDIAPLEGGHRLIVERDVLTAIDRRFGFDLRELPLGAIDVERLERVLEEEPFILDADAFFDAENTIHIKVAQRPPVLRIIDHNGLNYYLDAGGMKMPLSPHFSARVLVATGNIPPHVPDFLERPRHSLKDVFLLARRLREDAFFQPLIEQVYVNPQGDMVLVPKVGDQKIIVGDGENLAAKLANLRTFYREAIPYEGWQKYRTINLKYEGQVVAERK